MKQEELFGEDFKNKIDNTYTSKIETPEYLPKNKCPFLLELIDDSKSKRLANEIINSNLSDDEKQFLILASKRHNVFNYSKIADYYSHATSEMQHLMERSALVIIDFEKAYINGYINLANDMANNYFTTYGE